MKIKLENGTVREVEDLDINVWQDETDGTVRLTAYESYTGRDGYAETNTGVILFSAATCFSPEDYLDEWYGWNASAPGEIPGEVVNLVRGILTEVTV